MRPVADEHATFELRGVGLVWALQTEQEGQAEKCTDEKVDRESCNSSSCANHRQWLLISHRCKQTSCPHFTCFGLWEWLTTTSIGRYLSGQPPWCQRARELGAKRTSCRRSAKEFAHIHIDSQTREQSHAWLKYKRMRNRNKCVYAPQNQVKRDIHILLCDRAESRWEKQAGRDKWPYLKFYEQSKSRYRRWRVVTRRW